MRLLVADAPPRSLPPRPRSPSAQAAVVVALRLVIRPGRGCRRSPAKAPPRSGAGHTGPAHDDVPLPPLMSRPVALLARLPLPGLPGGTVRWDFVGDNDTWERKMLLLRTTSLL